MKFLDNLKRGAKPCLFAAWILVFWPVAGLPAEQDLDMLRVYATEPACFEYIFTGVVNETGDKPLLSFNHKSGDTFFVKVGEPLGEYRVKAYASKPKRVFNASLDAWLEEPERQATLVGPKGEPLVLKENRKLPRPGRVAWLVRLDNGVWWSVQELDVFIMDGTRAVVEKIDAARVAVTFGKDERSINLVSAGEKSVLKRLWAERRRHQERVRTLVLQQQRAAATQKTEVVGTYNPAYSVARPQRYGQVVFSSGSAGSVARQQRWSSLGQATASGRPSSFFYGTDYPFPTAFQAYPSVRYENGRPVVTYIVLPTTFERRQTGFSSFSR